MHRQVNFGILRNLQNLKNLFRTENNRNTLELFLDKFLVLAIVNVAV